MSRLQRAAAIAVLSLGLVAVTLPAYAFRMIQNNSTGRVTSGSQVTCTASGGFAHWTVRDVDWFHNTANQGGETGTAAALQSAMGAWNAVSDYDLNYAGTTTAGWSTDGQNTFLWASGNGCTGTCLALTALVLQSGQEIVETDVTFNNSYNWQTNGNQYDVRAVATHELGHSLGIHHTELSGTPHPTMYASYFGTDERSLESDDRNAIACSEDRYCLQYQLSGDGTVFAGSRWAFLSWGSACIPTSNVDVFRDGSKIATTANDGAYTDRIFSSVSSANYWVCEAGSTTWYDSDTCSNVVTVYFNYP